MDGLGIRVLCAEWNEWFEGARIDKVHQPNQRELVLTVRGKGQTARILLCAHKQFARAHLLRTVRPANPLDPPMFCMLLRKRIEGGRIVSITQPGWERIVHIHVSALDDLGDETYYVLILEVMGKYSNLIFCTSDEDGKPLQVVDSLVHVTPDMSRVRQVLPGLAYASPPPQDKQTIENLKTEQVAQILASHSAQKAITRGLMSAIHGLGPDTVREAWHRAANTGELSAENLMMALKQLYRVSISHEEPASVGQNELGYVEAAAPFRVTYTPRTEELSSYDLAVELLYEEASRKSQVTAAFREIEQGVLLHLDRLRGKRVKLLEQREGSEDIDVPRIKGELLMTYAYQVPKGTKKVELPNFYDEERPLEIELDAALSATQNATHYFKVASKHKRAIPILDEEIARTVEDIDYLDGVLANLEQADASHYPSIRSELEKQGFLKAKRQFKGTKTGRVTKGAKRNPKDDIGKPDEYWSEDGYRIRVGRNNLQNDKLTLRWSRPDDTWLHVKDAPGSHVVIEAGGKSIPESTIQEAALIAAYFSKSRSSGNVPVDFTLVRHIWKPNGARPGHVLYDHQHTLYLTPDKAMVDATTSRKGMLQRESD